MAYLTSSGMASLFPSQRFSAWQSSCPTDASSSPMVTSSPVHSWHLSSNNTSHAVIDLMSSTYVLVVSIDRSCEFKNESSGFAAGETILRFERMENLMFGFNVEDFSNSVGTQYFVSTGAFLDQETNVRP